MDAEKKETEENRVAAAFFNILNRLRYNLFQVFVAIGHAFLSWLSRKFSKEQDDEKRVGSDDTTVPCDKKEAQQKGEGEISSQKHAEQPNESKMRAILIEQKDEELPGNKITEEKVVELLTSTKELPEDREVKEDGELSNFRALIEEVDGKKDGLSNDGEKPHRQEDKEDVELVTVVDQKNQKLPAHTITEKTDVREGIELLTSTKELPELSNVRATIEEEDEGKDENSNDSEKFQKNESGELMSVELATVVDQKDEELLTPSKLSELSEERPVVEDGELAKVKVAIEDDDGTKAELPNDSEMSQGKEDKEYGELTSVELRTVVDQKDEEFLTPFKLSELSAERDIIEDGELAKVKATIKDDDGRKVELPNDSEKSQGKKDKENGEVTSVELGTVVDQKDEEFPGAKITQGKNASEDADSLTPCIELSEERDDIEDGELSKIEATIEEDDEKHAELLNDNEKPQRKEDKEDGELTSVELATAVDQKDEELLGDKITEEEDVREDVELITSSKELSEERDIIEDGELAKVKATIKDDDGRKVELPNDSEKSQGKEDKENEELTSVELGTVVDQTDEELPGAKITQGKNASEDADSLTPCIELSEERDVIEDGELSKIEATIEEDDEKHAELLNDSEKPQRKEDKEDGELTSVELATAVDQKDEELLGDKITEEEDVREDVELTTSSKELSEERDVIENVELSNVKATIEDDDGKKDELPNDSAKSHGKEDKEDGEVGTVDRKGEELPGDKIIEERDVRKDIKLLTPSKGLLEKRDVIEDGELSKVKATIDDDGGKKDELPNDSEKPQRKEDGELTSLELTADIAITAQNGDDVPQENTVESLELPHVSQTSEISEDQIEEALAYDSQCFLLIDSKIDQKYVKVAEVGPKINNDQRNKEPESGSAIHMQTDSKTVGQKDVAPVEVASEMGDEQIDEEMASEKDLTTIEVAPEMRDEEINEEIASAIHRWSDSKTDENDFTAVEVAPEMGDEPINEEMSSGTAIQPQRHSHIPEAKGDQEVSGIDTSWSLDDALELPSDEPSCSSYIDTSALENSEVRLAQARALLPFHDMGTSSSERQIDDFTASMQYTKALSRSSTELTCSYQNPNFSYYSDTDVSLTGEVLETDSAEEVD